MDKKNLITIAVLVFVAFTLYNNLNPVFKSLSDTNTQMVEGKYEAQRAVDSLNLIKNKTSYQKSRLKYYKDRVAFYNRMGAQTSTHSFSMLSIIFTIVGGLGLYFVAEKISKKQLSNNKSKVSINDFDDYRHDNIGEYLSWTSLQTGASNATFQQLVEVNPNLIKIKNTILLKLIIGISALVGLSQAFFAYYKLYKEGILFDLSITELLSKFPMFSIMFMMVPIFIYFLMYVNSSFDKRSQNFTNGSKQIPFSTIYAVQFLTVIMRKGRRNYEINLVLNDGNRIPVMISNNHDIAEYDAVTLARFLNVPAWKI